MASLLRRNYTTEVVEVVSHRSFVVIFFLLLCCSVNGCYWFRDTSGRVDEAEHLAAQGKYEQAIALYRAHISERAAVSDRPDWENPYFYLLSIGDLQLQSERPDLALQSFDEAADKGVQAELISDRYRALASWYIEHGQLEKALEFLTSHRARDSLLFDSMLDRVARELTERESRSRQTPAAQ